MVDLVDGVASFSIETINPTKAIKRPTLLKNINIEYRTRNLEC